MSSTEGILHQDEWLFVVAKPSGMPVQPDPTGDADLVTLWRVQLKEPSIELVHRIDRPVSGAVLLCRTVEALPVLHAMFRERRMEKHYWAIVEGPVEEDDATFVLEHSLEHDQHKKKARVKDDPTGEMARLSVRVLARGDRYTALEVVPEGGAFHQIRAQLAAWGHPIKGDVKYGARRGEKDRSIALHARSLRFTHPFTGKGIIAVAPLPPGSLWRTLLPEAVITPDPRP